MSSATQSGERARGGIGKGERSTASWVTATPVLDEIKARPAHILSLTNNPSIVQCFASSRPAEAFFRSAVALRAQRLMIDCVNGNDRLFVPP